GGDDDPVGGVAGRAGRVVWRAAAACAPALVREPRIRTRDQRSLLPAGARQRSELRRHPHASLPGKPVAAFGDGGGGRMSGRMLLKSLSLPPLAGRCPEGGWGRRSRCVRKSPPHPALRARCFAPPLPQAEEGTKARAMVAGIT